jgi:UDP-N-acetylmuramate dehydrogenase
MAGRKPSVKEAVKIIKKTGLKNVIFDIDTSKITSIKAGGRALCYFVAGGIEDLKKMIRACLINELEFMIIGDCTNILFSDNYENMVLIKLGKGFDYIKFGHEDNIIKGNIIAGAGCNLSKFIARAAGRGYDFSEFSGIPGTLGGSIRGNSGSREAGICDFVKKIRIIAYHKDDIVEETINLDKSNFGYRHLDITGLVAITEIIFGAKKSNEKDIIKKIAKKIKKKKKAQPISSRSSGCFFKNIDGYPKSTGQLIEECGLKGFIYGGARISDKHANFIENFKNASSQDIFVLSRIVSEIVMDKFNKKLDYEVKLVGF